MKKNILSCILVMSFMAIMFVGCGNEDAVKEEESSSENSSVSEESVISEEVSEENSETVSEEINEEAVGVDYSADTVMALCDELAEKYVYDDPEYIKSLVIAGNLDYITEEDLNIILTTWGYTMEDLAAIYEEGIESSITAYFKWRERKSGSSAYTKYEIEWDYAKRVMFEQVMLNPEDKELACQFDESILGNKGIPDFVWEEPTTSGETLISAVGYTFGYGVMETPYTEYVPEKSSEEEF
ncbi:MAG: hypothetical protein IJ336_02575 [Lachnospiraceae bacterium]|nr:hypothetical protein [Lachnospiraceae bacterium]